MKRMLVLLFAALLVAGSASIASAQLTSAKEGPVVYGHHHLNTTNMDAQKKFFVDTLGGTLIKIGTNNAEIVEVPERPDLLPRDAGADRRHARHDGQSHRLLGAEPPSGGRQDQGERLQDDHRHRSRPAAEVKDDIAGPLQPGGASIAFALAPDDVKVEFVEAKQQTIPITLHHVHFFNPKNTEMQAWYVKTFGANARGTAARFRRRDLPGVALNFSPSTDSGGRHAGARARSHRLRSQEPRGVHARSWKPTASS